MMRFTPFLLILLAAAPVVAQQAGTRFAIAPADSGVTRIDTHTGQVSHCAPRNGTWTCEPFGPSAPTSTGAAPTPPAAADSATSTTPALTAPPGAQQALPQKAPPPEAAAAPAQPAAPAPALATKADIERLTEAVGSLAQRVDVLAERVQQTTQAPPAQNSPGLSTIAVQRLVELVRRLKHTEG